MQAFHFCTACPCGFSRYPQNFAHLQKLCSALETHAYAIYRCNLEAYLNVRPKAGGAHYFQREMHPNVLFPTVITLASLCKRGVHLVAEDLVQLTTDKRSDNCFTPLNNKSFRFSHSLWQGCSHTTWQDRGFQPVLEHHSSPKGTITKFSSAPR